MKNIYSFKNNKEDLYFEYFEDISLVTSNYFESIQNSFEQSYEMNDIDICNEDFNYLKYLENCPILVILKSNIVVGFLIFKYLPSIKALDYNLYIHSDQDVGVLKTLCQHAILVYIYIAKDMYDFEMYYFNVSHKIVFYWAKSVIKTGKCIKIRKNYYICYGKVDNQYIENIILKEVDIVVNDYKTI